MKKFLSSVLMLAMVLGMFHNVSGIIVNAQEVETTVLIGGSEKVLLEAGKTYSIPVSFMKSGDHTVESMAVDTLTGATLTVNTDGTVLATFTMKNATINGFFGYATKMYLNNTHESNVDATTMTIISTYTYKTSGYFGTSYTIPGEFQGVMPYLDQNGVYVQMDLYTSLMSMEQEGYFVFDFASVRADYSAIEAALKEVPTDLSIYTADSVSALNLAISQVEEYYHKDRQSEVTAMANAITLAVEALEEDTAIRMNSEVYGTVVTSPSTFTVSIPESIQLGTLSLLEDTIIPYQLGVSIIDGNDGRGLEVMITTNEDEELVQGQYEIPFVNSLTSHVFTSNEVVAETITVEASKVASAYHGNYQGTMTFHIDSEYVD